MVRRPAVLRGSALRASRLRMTAGPRTTGRKPMRKSVMLAAAALALVPATAHAQEKISDGVVKIGMIEDMSSLYADITGIGAVTAARMAAEDFGGKVLGKPIEVISADHQNKADNASTIAREWFDTQHVDALMDFS